MTNFDKELEKVNSRLKAAKLRVSVFRRQSKLWLRATLPPKPHIKRSDNYQQAISLDAKATVAGLKHAEQKAKQMSVELDSGKFDWAHWIEIKGANTNEQKTVGDWIKEFHEYKLSAHAIAPETWRGDYLGVAKKLPQEEVLTEQLLVKLILKSKPDTRNRKRMTLYCQQLANFAGLPVREIKKLTGSYSSKSVNPRCLPDDMQIQDFIDNIKDPGWKWLIGLIATYGLRSHEVFFS